MSEHTTWFHPRGTLARNGWETVVDGALPGWRHTGLRVGDLGSSPLHLAAADVERMVVPLLGDVEVETAGERLILAGRDSVFDGPADVAYLPLGQEATLRGSGRVAVAEAPTTRRLELAVLRAGGVAVELRGAGRASRQVHNFGVPGGLPATKLLVCEVITPAGNWSSYPPHKHDEDVPGHETVLEEIYYFELAPERGSSAPPTADPMAVFSTYSSPAGRIEQTDLIRSGDVALVPFGYHGPAAAAPGYDLYYLNVMAGPGDERAWRISDDPAHAWIRDAWAGERPDPRLPYRSGD